VLTARRASRYKRTVSVSVRFVALKFRKAVEYGVQMAKGLAADVRDGSFIAALLHVASEFAG